MKKKQIQKELSKQRNNIYNYNLTINEKITELDLNLFEKYKEENLNKNINYNLIK